MRNTPSAWGTCLWAALLFVSPAAVAAQRPAPPPPSLESTAWAVTDSMGGSYIFEFGRRGQFNLTSSAGVKSAGTWRQTGDFVVIEVNRLFSRYRGKFSGRKMDGRARSRGGSELAWSALRQEAVPVKGGEAFPIYPPIARAARASGVVVVEVQVGADGAVTAASVVSGHPILRQAAANAARLWKFAPGGKDAETRAARLIFAFRLVSVDCRTGPINPDPVTSLLSAYQTEVVREEMCIQ